MYGFFLVKNTGLSRSNSLDNTDNAWVHLLQKLSF